MSIWMTNNWRDRWFSRPTTPLVRRHPKDRHLGIPGLLPGLLLIALAPALSAAPFFKPFSAVFSVSRGAIPLGSLELKLAIDEAGGYNYHAHTRPGLLAGWFSSEEVIEESHGRLQGDLVIPQRYTYDETGDPGDHKELEFDWTAMQVHTTSEGITWSQSIDAETQDRLSQQLMVRLAFARGQQEAAYQVADGGKLKHYLFRVVGEEPVKTPYGRLRCLKVRRSKESRAPDYTIWFARELDYLPVRIERQQGSGRYRMELEELNGL